MALAAWFYMIGLFLLSYAIFILWPQRSNEGLRYQLIVKVLSAALFFVAGWTFVTLRNRGRQMVIIFFGRAKSRLRGAFFGRKTDSIRHSDLVSAKAKCENRIQLEASCT
jgi:hypothetical protein